MRIAIIGHGKMGRTIESIAVKNDIEVPLIIDLHNQHLIRTSSHTNKKLM